MGGSECWLFVTAQEVEEARHTLLELQAVAAAVESSGQSKAEAQARAEKLLIEGQSAIECELVMGAVGRGWLSWLCR